MLSLGEAVEEHGVMTMRVMIVANEMMAMLAFLATSSGETIIGAQPGP